MSVKSKIAPLTAAVIIVLVIGSTLAMSVTLTTAANAAPDKTSTYNGGYLNTAFRMHGNFNASRHWKGTGSWNGTKSWNVTTTSSQAQAIVTETIPSFTIGGANDRGSLWMVNVTYNGTLVMNVPLGKVNTPTSTDAVSAVQASQSKGWTAGTPKLFAFMYSVPIVDSNGNTIGTVRVNGTNGQIITGKTFAGFRMRPRA